MSVTSDQVWRLVVTQGQGKFTANKIRCFEASFKQNVSVVASALKSKTYFHFDMNAGCGWNEKANCRGSPLAFRVAANEAGMPNAFAFCCELDSVSAQQLAQRTKKDRYTFVIHGRNQVFANLVPHIIKRYGVNPKDAYGSVLVDPNDHNKCGIPFDELRSLTEKCPRLDVFFHFPQLAIKRVTGAIRKGVLDASHSANCFSIEDMPQIIGKKHLWIKQTPEMGNFALVVGRNTPNIKSDKRTGLAEWNSEMGVYYRERCSFAVGEAEARHRIRQEKIKGQRMLFT